MLCARFVGLIGVIAFLSGGRCLAELHHRMTCPCGPFVVVASCVKSAFNALRRAP